METKHVELQAAKSMKHHPVSIKVSSIILAVFWGQLLLIVTRTNGAEFL